MEELFGNILYLIPIALILSFRILNAKKNQARKQQQQQEQQKQKQTGGDTAAEKPSVFGGLGELIKKVQELENEPNYGKTGKESYRPHWETRPVLEQPGKKKKVTPKKSAVRMPSADQSVSVFPDTLAGETKLTPAAIIPAAPVQAAVSGFELLQTRLSGKPPLQQAVIWTEILGQPKGM